VLGRIKLRKRQQKLEMFIFIKVPAWNSEVLFLPGHMGTSIPTSKTRVSAWIWRLTLSRPMKKRWKISGRGAGRNL
jgi:hypothetical protein